MNHNARLPWSTGATPLMLAPMQGLTNTAMRSLFIDWVRPDVVFTEFMRVSGVSRKRLSPTDLRDAKGEEKTVPLVVQLVGSGRRALVEAARIVQCAGARHINLNLGCPYGRMTTAATGGKLLRHPRELADIIPALREVIDGSFSVKLRAGYEHPEEVFALLELFETAEVDFLVLHPRTVLQEFQGHADHTLTKKVIQATRLPVIANGDIRTAGQGRTILEGTSADGLMLGRGAIANPLLFAQLRDADITERPSRAERAQLLHRYLGDLLERYRQLFCGDAQALSKLKGVLPFLDDPDFSKRIAQLKKAKSINSFRNRLAELQSKH